MTNSSKRSISPEVINHSSKIKKKLGTNLSGLCFFFFFFAFLQLFALSRRKNLSFPLGKTLLLFAPAQRDLHMPSAKLLLLSWRAAHKSNSGVKLKQPFFLFLSAFLYFYKHLISPSASTNTDINIQHNPACSVVRGREGGCCAKPAAPREPANSPSAAKSFG